jgi:hypothetical protein
MARGLESESRDVWGKRKVVIDRLWDVRHSYLAGPKARRRKRGVFAADAYQVGEPSCLMVATVRSVFGLRAGLARDVRMIGRPEVDPRDVGRQAGAPCRCGRRSDAEAVVEAEFRRRWQLRLQRRWELLMPGAGPPLRGCPAAVQTLSSSCLRWSTHPADTRFRLAISPPAPAIAAAAINSTIPRTPGDRPSWALPALGLHGRGRMADCITAKGKTGRGAADNVAWRVRAGDVSHPPAV